ALYRAINGRSAPCGQLPAIGGATIQTRKAQLHASLFARIYERLGGAGVYQTLDVRSAMHAHDLYRLLVPEGTAEIDFTLAWVAYSGRSLPPIPEQGCHPFHGKPATDATRTLPPIPVKSATPLERGF
ncbi:MAG: FlhC family transcriptional regulator, partial [Chromatiaceae bacterium]